MGILGLILAVVGLYGVVAYTVSQRTREIGLRMALGADRANVLRLILRDGMRLVAVGIGIGMVLAVAATRVMSSFLFGVSPLDPLVFAAIPLGLCAATLVASYLPARRAAATDPLEALRSWELGARSWELGARSWELGATPMFTTSANAAPSSQLPAPSYSVGTGAGAGGAGSAAALNGPTTLLAAFHPASVC